MRIRIIPRPGKGYQVMAEQRSGKGKKVTTGETVPREGLKAEVARLIKALREDDAKWGVMA